MNIVVCVKQIRHTYARTGASPQSHYIRPEDNIFRVDPHDEAALELALRLKSTHGDDIRVILLTLGPMHATRELQRCLAAGADELIQIQPEGQSPSGDDPLDQPDSWVKADLLAKASREIEGDIVLCGKASIDRGSGQLGALLAHRLDMPFVSAITDLKMDASASGLHVQRSAGRGVREIIQCRAPAVFTVDLGTELRMPTIPRRQWAEGYIPRQLAYAVDGDEAKLVCRHRFQPRPRPKMVPAPDSRLHAYDRIMQLLTGSTIEKKGEILSGSPASQVDGIIAFLEANGFLEPESKEQ